MISSKRSLALLALIVPSLLLSGNLITQHNALQKAKAINLPLGGYDPVSILHGHYVRIKFDRQTIATNKRRDCKSNCILCFDQNEKGAWQAAYVSTKNPPSSCTYTTNNLRLLSTSHKYYVDERKAERLDDLLHQTQRARNQQRSIERAIKKGKPINETILDAGPQFSMDVAMLKNGAIAFRMLRIDGLPWADYLATHK